MKNDGGPAFPVTIEPEPDVFKLMPGISVRDYFAAKAMESVQISEMIESFRRNDYSGKQDHNTYLPLATAKEVAEYAYVMADAMLAARGQA